MPTAAGPAFLVAWRFGDGASFGTVVGDADARGRGDLESSSVRWLRRMRGHWRQSVRMTVAAVIACAATGLIGAHRGEWAVITCLVVVQASFANTWDASLSRVLGTAAGALAGGAGALARGWADAPVLLALALTVAPMAALAAADQRFRLAPVTAGLVLLSVPGGDALRSVVADRVGEIVLGVTVGVACALLVFPERAAGALRRRAADALDALGEVLRAHLRREPVEDHQLRLDAAFVRVQGAAAELVREQRLHLAGGVPPQAFVTALRRLRTDVALIERAMQSAGEAPDPTRLADGFAAWFVGAADAVRSGRALPPPAALERDGAGDPVPGFDALGFALDTMRREQLNIARRAAELTPVRHPRRQPA